MFRTRTFLLTLCVMTALALACSSAPTTSDQQSVQYVSSTLAPDQSHCDLTYPTSAVDHVFTVGTHVNVQGEIWADGECQGVTQTLQGLLPKGLTFTTDGSRRRWTISGTPTQLMAKTVYTIEATAECCRGGFRSTSTSVSITVAESGSVSY